MLAMSVSKKAIVTYHLADDLPPIHADAAQIAQVIMDLVINASEALGEHVGTIAVSTAALDLNAALLAAGGLGQELPEGRYVCLDVADSGCGMDDDVEEKIFDPFFTTKFMGRGLGLAAVHGIVRGHHGAVQVASEPGRGTTFRVLFPTGDSGARRGAVAPSQLSSTPGGESGTVLVVDDDEAVRTMTRRMIEQAGFTVLTASGGREAIRLFREHRQEIGCVVLDLVMPDLDGVETFRELRGFCPEVRVILSSGYSEETATERFTQEGLAGFIQKPYAMAPLIEQIRQAIAQQCARLLKKSR